MAKEQLLIKKRTSKSNSVEIALLDERYKTMSDDITTLKGDTKEIKKGLETLTQTVIGLPNELTKTFDIKYASKSLEEDVKSLKEKNEQRNYEWLKYLIMIGVGALLAYFGLK